jgi:hypothetical protein
VRPGTSPTVAFEKQYDEVCAWPTLLRPRPVLELDRFRLPENQTENSSEHLRIRAPLQKYLSSHTLWRPLPSNLHIRGTNWCEALANALAVHLAHNSWPIKILNEVVQRAAETRERHLQAHESRKANEMQRKHAERVQEMLRSSLPRLRDACGDEALAHLLMSGALRLTQLINAQQFLPHGSVEEMTALVAALLSAAWKQNACSDDDIIADHADTPRPSRRNTIVRMLIGTWETATVNAVEAKLMTSIASSAALP